MLSRLRRPLKVIAGKGETVIQFLTRLCGCSSVAERQLPKLDVVSSILITRFAKLAFCGCSSVVEHHVANVRVVSSNLITRFLRCSFRGILWI
jgi:uncharacterized protein YceK